MSAEFSLSYGLSATGGGGTDSLLTSVWSDYSGTYVELKFGYRLTTQSAHGGLGDGENLTLGYGLGGTTYNAESFALPQFALTAQGVSGGYSAGAFALPALDITIGAIVGKTLAGEFSLPALDLIARLGNGSDLPLNYALSASGAGAGSGVFSQRLPAAGLTATGTNPVYLTGAPALPTVNLSAGMNVGSAGGAVLPLRPIGLTATGSGGSAGQAAVTLPAVRLTTIGYVYAEMAGGFSLAYGVRAERVGLAPAAQVSGTAFAMTARTGALTTYSNFGFNSFARFQGKNIAVGSAGLYELSGLTDAGTPVAARIRGTVNEAGVTQAKRLLSAFCGYKANGALEFRVRADQQGADNIYTMPPNDTGLYRNRVKFGRGATGSYWEWEVRNLGGAQFELDVIELEAVVLPRKRA